MGHPNAKEHRGGRPYARKPLWGVRPVAAVELAVLEWCRLRGLDPNAKGVHTEALCSLALAGAAANPRGVDVTREDRRVSVEELSTRRMVEDWQATRYKSTEDVQPPAADVPAAPPTVLHGWTLGVESRGALAFGRISRGSDRHTCGHMNGHRTEKGALACARKMAIRWPML